METLESLRHRLKFFFVMSNPVQENSKLMVLLSCATHARGGLGGLDPVES